MCTRCWKDLRIPGHPGVPRCSTHGCAAGVLTGAPHSPFGGRAHGNDGEGIGTRIRNTTNLATIGGKKIRQVGLVDTWSDWYISFERRTAFPHGGGFFMGCSHIHRGGVVCMHEKFWLVK